MGPYGNGVRIQGQKREPELHGGIVIKLADLRVLAHTISGGDVQGPDIAGFRSTPGSSLKILQGLLVFLPGICQIFLCVGHIFLGRFDLPVHIGGIDAIEHLALFHLVSLFKIRLYDLTLHQGCDGVGILCLQGSGGGELTGNVSPGDGAYIFGIHHSFRFLFLSLQEDKGCNGCNEEHCQEDDPLSPALPAVLPFGLFI